MMGPYRLKVFHSNLVPSLTRCSFIIWFLGEWWRNGNILDWMMSFLSEKRRGRGSSLDGSCHSIISFPLHRTRSYTIPCRLHTSIPVFLSSMAHSPPLSFCSAKSYSPIPLISPFGSLFCSLFHQSFINPGFFRYRFGTLGLGLHSSACTACSITLFGNCGVLSAYPLLQS